MAREQPVGGRQFPPLHLTYSARLATGMHGGIQQHGRIAAAQPFQQRSALSKSGLQPGRSTPPLRQGIEQLPAQGIVRKGGADPDDDKLHQPRCTFSRRKWVAQEMQGS